jgi:hypothetical protein
MTSRLAQLRGSWDRVVGATLLIGGGMGVALALLAIAGSQSRADRLSFVASGVIGGVFCAGLGAALLVSARLQDEWRALDRPEALDVREFGPTPPVGHAASNEQSTTQLAARTP